MNRKLLSILFVLLIAFDSVPCKNLASFADATIKTITSDSESDLKSAISTLNKQGGVIYINTSVINISSTSTLTLSGTISGGIVGMKQSDGTYPRIDFKKARKAGSTARGFTVSGSNLYMKNLIIENAGDNGIWVCGSNNLFEYIIARYNGDTGIQLSDNANANRLNFCYSYRNIDVKTYGANADGFAPKLGATRTIFNYCFAWDNSDDGWDSYDKQGDDSAEVQYLHSACWNNGNPDVFIGKYDYDKGKSLDKNLWTIQDLISSDSSFESNYKNRKFSISKGKISGMSANSWLAQAIQEMNGNGFKFGSKTTLQSTKVLRKAVYSVAFDHKSKGFDNNNSQGCNGHIANCVSFNNNINYQLPYVFSKWASNWSWNPRTSHSSRIDTSKYGFHYPKSASEATKAFYAIRDKIIANCKANKFSSSVHFDDAIKALA